MRDDPEAAPSSDIGRKFGYTSRGGESTRGAGRKFADGVGALNGVTARDGGAPRSIGLALDVDRSAQQK